ncbi:hypothetical protein B0H19DRAFT_1069339 [Mycena capillaripes]|nr:hypothetical protein B0H19DRAFT_1069339 [Mycena capillaripes]
MNAVVYRGWFCGRRVGVALLFFLAPTMLPDIPLGTSTTKITLKFTPIATPATDPPAEEDLENATPNIPGLNLPADGYARLAQEILKLAPGSTAGVTSPKKRRASSKWAVTIANQLRTTKEARCGVENAEQFVFKAVASDEEVQGCEDGYLEPDPDDYRFHFGPGYLNTRWNLLILNKIVDATMIEGQHLTPVPREWLLQQLTGQMKRAREAWARPHPRGNETAAEGIARANRYCEERAENTRGNSAKSRASEWESFKFNERERIIELIICLKTGTNAPDVEAWKRILEMLLHLGNTGMSSEEEFEKLDGKTKWTGFKVKICVWRAQDVDDILWMVDGMGEKLSKGKFGPPGPKRLPRERTGAASVTGAPKGLPECLHDAGWIEKESEKSPVFYADLEVSKKAFYLLAASADMVGCSAVSTRIFKGFTSVDRKTGNSGRSRPTTHRRFTVVTYGELSKCGQIQFAWHWSRPHGCMNPVPLPALVGCAKIRSMRSTRFFWSPAVAELFSAYQFQDESSA